MLRLWDLNTETEVCSGPIANSETKLSADGRLLAYQTTAGNLAVAALAPGLECRFLAIDKPHGTSMVSTVVTGGRIATSKPATLALSFDPTGRFLVSAHDDGVRFWESKTGTLVGHRRTDGTEFVRFEPSVENLLVAGPNGIERWPVLISPEGSPIQVEVGAAKVVDREPSLGRHAVFGLNAAGTALAAVANGQAYVLELSGRCEKRVVFGAAPVEFVTLSPNGEWCAAVNTEDGAPPTGVVYVAEVGTGKVLSTLRAPGVTAVAFSPDDRWLAVGHWNQYQLVDTRSWQAAVSIRRDAGGQPAALSFSPDSRLLAVVWSARVVRLIETSTGRQIATLESPEAANISCLAFSPDGTQLAVGRWDHPIALWDLRLIRKELASMKLDWDLPPYP
jgi:WD40 repeat protein